MITNRALYTNASRQLTNLQTKYSYLPINHHDWQDLRQNIMIRIFEKKDQIKDGLNVYGWIHTVIDHAFQNHMRDLLRQQAGGPSRRAMMAVRFPRTLGTRIIRLNDAGEQEIRYEPDVIAPTDNISSDDRARVAEIIETLPSQDRRILKTYAETKSWNRTAKKMGLSYYVCYGTGLEAIAQVRRELTT